MPVTTQHRSLARTRSLKFALYWLQNQNISSSDKKDRVGQSGGRTRGSGFAKLYDMLRGGAVSEVSFTSIAEPGIVLVDYVTGEFTSAFTHRLQPTQHNSRHRQYSDY
jgi:hypothetical protein